MKTLVRYFCKMLFWLTEARLTNNGLSVIANDDQTILLSAAVPLQAYLDSHEFAWIPQNDHIGCEWWFGQEMWNCETTFHAQSTGFDGSQRASLVAALEWIPIWSDQWLQMAPLVHFHMGTSTNPEKVVKMCVALRFGCISWSHRMAWSQRQQKTENQCQDVPRTTTGVSKTKRPGAVHKRQSFAVPHVS